MKHNQFFIDNDLASQEVRSITEYIQNDKNENPLEQKYRDKISAFLKKHSITDVKYPEAVEILLFNYWYILLIYRKHDTWKDSTLTQYFNASIRIIEFTIYICHTENKKLIDIFLDTRKDALLFIHFQAIEHAIDEKKFSIIYDAKHNKITLSASESYKSTIPTQPKEEGKHNSDFSFYFKLHHEQIIKIYNLEDSKNIIDGRNANGGNWKRTPFMDREEYLEHLLPFDNKEMGKENSKEFEARKNKISSFDITNKDLIFGENSEEETPVVEKINFSSPYKRYLVNKAIGQSITRQNLSLRSDYNIPDIEVLFVLLNTAIKENSLHANLTFLTVVFGIRTEKLIYAIAELDNNIKFIKRDSKLKIDGSGKKNIFATYELDEEIAKNTDIKDVEIYLPRVIIRIWEETKTFILDRFNYALRRAIEGSEDRVIKYLGEVLKDDLSLAQKYQYITKNAKDIRESIPDILDLPMQIVTQIVNENREFVKDKVKRFHKNISLKHSTLPHLFLHLFKTRKKESDIHLLFTGVMNKNDEARVCYASVPPRLIHYESWQMELIHLLGVNTALLDKYGIDSVRNPNSISQSNDWTGSKLYIKGTYFQKFLVYLLSLKVKDEIDKTNVKMIFLKYVLSCLTGARDFRASISMEQYSKREKIIFIQEKGKNLFSSKRIIPLSSSGILLVEKFMEMKKEYGFNSYYPCFLEIDENRNQVETVMNRKNITTWLNSKISEENKDLITDILRFVEHTPLNFGRHIFTSYAIQSSAIDSQYIDAYLNHYKMGTEDQGIYSHFNNQDYFYQVRKILEDIERIYIPKKWDKLW